MVAKKKASSSKSKKIEEIISTNTTIESDIINNAEGNIVKINSAIPYSTVISIALIGLFKRDHLQDIVDMGMKYCGLTFYQFIAMIIVAFLILMGIILLIFSRIKHNAKVKADRIMYIEKSTLERDALIKFFNSTGGNQWKDKTRWCSNSPVNLWKGVKLSQSGYVNKILLPSNRLDGILPEEIFINLPHLIEIDLRDNHLIGSIPVDIAILPKLQGLYLFENYLTGKIPDEFADSKTLTGIYLYNNCLEDIERTKVLLKSKLKETCIQYI